MSWIVDGGPFAYAIVAWAVIMAGLLTLENRKAPLWFPGLHAGLLAVLFGLGTTGWLLGLRNVMLAVGSAGEAHKVKLLAMGNAIAPYPFIVAGIAAAIVLPIMAWNRQRTDRTLLKPAPVIHGLTWATGMLLAVATFLAVPLVSSALSSAFLGDAPHAQLQAAVSLSAAAIPVGLLNITLSLVAARRHHQVREDPVLRRQAAPAAEPERAPRQPRPATVTS